MGAKNSFIRVYTGLYMAPEGLLHISVYLLLIYNDTKVMNMDTKEVGLVKRPGWRFFHSPFANVHI